jgi:hypothetical protein
VNCGVGKDRARVDHVDRKLAIEKLIDGARAES